MAHPPSSSTEPGLRGGELSGLAAAMCTRGWTFHPPPVPSAPASLCRRLCGYTHPPLRFGGRVACQHPPGVCLWEEAKGPGGMGG
jgi:hypothetical protein